MYYVFYRSDNNLVVGTALISQDLERMLSNFKYLDSTVNWVKYDKPLPSRNKPMVWNSETETVEIIVKV